VVEGEEKKDCRGRRGDCRRWGDTSQKRMHKQKELLNNMVKKKMANDAKKDGKNTSVKKQSHNNLPRGCCKGGKGRPLVLGKRTSRSRANSQKHIFAVPAVSELKKRNHWAKGKVFQNFNDKTGKGRQKTSDLKKWSARGQRGEKDRGTPDPPKRERIRINIRMWVGKRVDIKRRFEPKPKIRDKYSSKEKQEGGRAIRRYSFRLGKQKKHVTCFGKTACYEEGLWGSKRGGVNLSTSTAL